MQRLFKIVGPLYLFILLPVWFGCSSDDSNPIVNRSILGQWRVTAVHNSSPTGPTIGPNDDEVISLTFTASGTFSGTTSANTFNGRYDATEDKLFIEELISTEVAETNFGQAFYGAFTDSQSFNNGVSEFEIVIQNDDRFNLEYQGFKFMTLERQ